MAGRNTHEQGWNMAAEPSGQVGWGPLPVPPEPVLDSKDVENYLGEMTRGFMTDIRAADRGIGWAATVFRQGSSRTLAASSEQARAADREQCSFADGPVLEALGSGEFVLLSDLSVDRRWPGYSSAAAGHGVLSLLAVPIVSEGAGSAAITLYSPEPHTFTSDDILRSSSYARKVAGALRMVAQVAGHAESAAGIAVVRSSLVLVDLAARGLMNEYGLSREAALRTLQAQALSHELDLRDALHVVVPGPAPESPGLRPQAAPGTEPETGSGG